MRAGEVVTVDGGRTGAAESRQATDGLLAMLREGGWRGRSWARFGWATAARSSGQARAHPRAVAEISALHLGLALLAGRPGRRWVATSWVMAVTHLGLLGGRRSIGAASAVTLLRANVPAIPSAGTQRWLGVAAVLSDKVDGVLARRAGPTQFGHYADSLADASFWAWFAWCHEHDRRVLVGAGMAWVAPVVAVTVASVARGGMVEMPRPALFRPAAAMQAVLAMRAVRSGAVRSGAGVRPGGPAVTVGRRR